ncbi:type III pantothenate kinase [bacterium]|nr:type III pantothenate kinase [bacterium]
MFLCLEIGNTNLKGGVFEGRVLKKTFIHPGEKIEKFNFPSEWRNLHPEKVGISSVVPDIIPHLISVVEKIYGLSPVVITHKNCKMKLRVEKPERTGIDRILNCKAAIEIFGKPAVVIDIGTAITIDVVSRRGEFLGGLILPGPSLWIKSLEKTALISDVKVKKGKLIGKNTDEAISSGLMVGISGAVEKAVEKLMKIYPEAKIVITGEGSKNFLKVFKFKYYWREFLTLEGVNFVLEK